MVLRDNENSTDTVDSSNSVLKKRMVVVHFGGGSQIGISESCY